MLANFPIEREQSDCIARVAATDDAAKESTSRFEFVFQFLRCRAAGIDQKGYRERLFRIALEDADLLADTIVMNDEIFSS